MMAICSRKRRPKTTTQARTIRSMLAVSARSHIACRKFHQDGALKSFTSSAERKSRRNDCGTDHGPPLLTRQMAVTRILLFKGKASKRSSTLGACTMPQTDTRRCATKDAHHHFAVDDQV